ncbi:MAG: hypothetical protein JNM56_00690 [Planctomycetia bacterium]|nr:hypothetical protein [Planctomycetia bacterium]
MVKYITESLAVDGRTFPFELCCKDEQFGSLALSHWWMNTRRLYGQRLRPAPNLLNITDYFWALCRKHGTAHDPEVQESFLLARLLPHVRSNAGRRVFADAHLTRPERLGSSIEEARAELETLLQASRNQTLSMMDFKNRTADILGPPVLTPEVQDRYPALTDDLLGHARVSVVKSDSTGMQIAIDRWQQLMRRIGRRAGQALDKQVLDILSYECRAAFHRCYSAVWWDLIPRLTLNHGLSPANQRFLHFWHLDHCSESAQGPHAWFHLFHGHIFALHPAGAALMQSPTGRSLLGAWLTEPASERAFGQLLHALLVVLHGYAEQRETGAGTRRKQPISSDNAAVLELEKAVVGKLQRRRRVRIRPTDAR